jgi:hypothetical protein
MRSYYTVYSRYYWGALALPVTVEWVTFHQKYAFLAFFQRLHYTPRHHIVSTPQTIHGKRTTPLHSTLSILMLQLYTTMRFGTHAMVRAY